MKNGTARLSIVISCSILILVLASSAFAKIPEGYRDIKLGMKKGQVLDIFKKGPMHFSFNDSGSEINEIVRGDDLFRYATYKFDGEGVLIEIDLQMREILGREKCLEIFGHQHGIQISPLKGSGDANVSIEVKENALIMRKNKDTRSASRASSS